MTQMQLLRPEGLVRSPAFTHVAIVPPGATTVYVGGQNAVTADGTLVGGDDAAGSGDLPINRRSSGPPLSLYARSRRSVCVASGVGKVPGLATALAAGYISDLIVDNRTAIELLRRTTPAARGRLLR